MCCTDYVLLCVPAGSLLDISHVEGHDFPIEILVVAQKAENGEEYLISSIEMDLREALFVQVMDIAFEASENQAH
jgi:hypothetical protein